MTTSLKPILGLVAGLALAISFSAVGCGGDDSSPLLADAGDDGSPNTDATVGDGGPDAQLADGAPSEAGPACTGGLTSCGGSCVDTRSNGLDCGGCGVVCTGDSVCSNGACTTTCLQGSTACGNSCLDLSVDPNNCGGCGKKCAAGLLCSAGTCATTCVGGLTACASSNGSAPGGVIIDAGDGGGTLLTCVDTARDDANCGACGKTCAIGQVCSNGACALSCQAGLVECGGTCVDPQSNRSFCGATAGCGSVDAGGTAGSLCASGQVCNAGKCGTSCQTGLVDCSGNCVDPTTNNALCGASGNCTNDGMTGDSAGIVCAPGTVCSGNGHCQANCQPDEILCGTTCVNPLSNPTFCGAKGSCANDGVATDSKGTSCANGQLCSSGKCQATCSTGQVVCNNTCIDPMTDPNHCGASVDCSGTHAGTACVGGQVCTKGGCATSCQPDEILCGTTCVNPLTNPGFCGAMGKCNAATGANTTGTVCSTGDVCSNGTCGLTCPTGYIACNGTCIDPRTDTTFCGAAGTCDGSTGNGIGTTCASGTVCAGGSCGTICGANLTLCGTSCVNEAVDPSHCGTCAACAAEPGVTEDVCRGGNCAVATCQAGTADCNATFGDGCEAQLSHDDANCGACGKACGTGTICVDSACVAGKRAFVTSAVFSTDLGGLDGADALCQSEAEAAKLSGTYRAWLSDDNGSPSTRFTEATVPYLRADGVAVASDFAGLASGTLLAPLNLTETGGTPSTVSYCGTPAVTVYTDTNPGAGQASPEFNCDEWLGDTTGTEVSWGDANSTDVWENFCEGSGGFCDPNAPYTAHLYCFQQ